MLINNGVAFVAAVVGLISFSKFKNSHVKYFIYFLWYVAIIQVLGSYTGFIEKVNFLEPLKKLVEGTVFENNYWVFTIFWSIGSALFYSYYFQSILDNSSHKKIILVSTNLFALCSIIYIIIYPNQLFNRAIPFVKIFGAFIVLSSAVFYFIKILRSDQLLVFYKSMNFFIAAVIFIWWLVTTPVVFFEIYFSSSDWSFVFLRWQIFLFMNLFMYLTFAFAFIWCKPVKT